MLLCYVIYYVINRGYPDIYTDIGLVYYVLRCGKIGSSTTKRKASKNDFVPFLKGSFLARNALT